MLPYLVGTKVGVPVGCDEGMPDVGVTVGRLVSPGLVGRDVVGTFDGIEVGLLEVGNDVGACTNITGVVTTTAVLTSEIESNPGPARRTSALYTLE